MSKDSRWETSAEADFLEGVATEALVGVAQEEMAGGGYALDGGAEGAVGIAEGV